MIVHHQQSADQCQPSQPQQLVTRPSRIFLRLTMSPRQKLGQQEPLGAKRNDLQDASVSPSANRQGMCRLGDQGNWSYHLCFALHVPVHPPRRGLGTLPPGPLPGITWSSPGLTVAVAVPGCRGLRDDTVMNSTGAGVAEGPRFLCSPLCNGYGSSW